MKNINRNQWIGVAVSLVVVGFLLYGNYFINLFMSGDNSASQANVSGSVVGVNIEDITVGTGAVAENGDTVTLHYVGMLSDGKIFDSSVDRGQPFSFTLGAGQVIRGFDAGLAGMMVGGKRRITIPPDLAYGDKVVGTIPANSTLIFDVELLNVQKGPVQ